MPASFKPKLDCLVPDCLDTPAEPICDFIHADFPVGEQLFQKLDLRIGPEEMPFGLFQSQRSSFEFYRFQGSAELLSYVEVFRVRKQLLEQLYF